MTGRWSTTRRSARSPAAGTMSIFRWTAPLVQRMARRWSQDDLRYIAERLRPHVPPGGVFVDLGGGTGDIGAGIARILHARVVVVDPVKQMLERVPADPLVSARLAGVESLPFPAGCFDGAFCCDAFHHFRDQDGAAREIARVVRPGGGVLILEAEPTGLNRALMVCERLLGEPGGMRMRADFEAFFAAHGVPGVTTPTRGSCYYFLGSVNGER